ncbi:MAG: hypothetical protein ACE5KM_02480 [Planctomycetaceae bacterium]
MIIRAFQSSRPRRGRATDRRGAALFAIVMSTALIVSLLALAALNVMRIERSSALRGQDAADARRYAQAAIEIGLQRINDDPNWRTTFTSGIWERNRPIGDGTYTLEGIDRVDGVLATPDTDAVVLIGTGRKGSATQKFQVTLVKDTRGLSSLKVAMHAGGGLFFSSGTVNCNQIVSSNTNVSNSAATVNSDVQAVNTITGVYNGTTTPGITPRQMPDASVFDPYIAKGTAVSYASLPAELTYRKLEDVVLSPASNPYGATNPDGIYVINCKGREIRVRNCRIVGTLVLLNTAPGSRIHRHVNWEPAVSNYPALLVKGSIKLRCDGHDLDEGKRGVNFNPKGTPYSGTTDTDIIDTYPNTITGLIYASGVVTIARAPTITGALVIGDHLHHWGNLTLNYRSIYRNNAPPGFRSGDMRVSPGSWRKITD